MKTINPFFFPSTFKNWGIEVNSNPLQYSRLENSMNSRVWWASSLDHKVSDMTERLTHTHLSIIFLSFECTTVIDNFWRLYSIYSYYKLFAIFPVLHNTSLQLTYLRHSSFRPSVSCPICPSPFLSLLAITSLFSASESVSSLLHALVCCIF